MKFKQSPKWDLEPKTQSLILIHLISLLSKLQAITIIEWNVFSAKISYILDFCPLTDRIYHSKINHGGARDSFVSKLFTNEEI